MKSIKVIGYGKYIPETTVTNDDLAEFVDTSDEWISSRTGIHNRAFAVDENTSDICTKAGMEILKNSKINPMDIDAVIVATITPDYLTPSTAALVASNIGAHNAFAFDISAACSGFVYGISVAHKYLLSGLYKNILVIGGEVLSKTLDFNDRTTCVLFGDGASGLLLTSEDKEKVFFEKLETDGGKGKAITAGYMPNTNYLSKEVEEKDKYMMMDGKEVFNFVVKTVPKNILSVIERSKVNVEDIKYFIPHQANRRMIETLSKKIKISMEKTYVNIDKYGNTSAGSVAIALCELLEKELVASGDLILLSGFGAGLTWATILLEL